MAIRDKKAAATENELKRYVTLLLAQPNLEQLVELKFCTPFDESRNMTIAITEDPGTRNSIHRLHWELIEDPSLSNSKSTVFVKHVIKLSDRIEIAAGQKMKPKMIEDGVFVESRVNGLLMVARDLFTEQDLVDVDPNLAIGILAKIKQDLSSQGYQACWNLKVVRPGTLED